MKWWIEAVLKGKHYWFSGTTLGEATDTAAEICSPSDVINVYITEEDGHLDGETLVGDKIVHLTLSKEP